MRKLPTLLTLAFVTPAAFLGLGSTASAAVPMGGGGYHSSCGCGHSHGHHAYGYGHHGHGHYSYGYGYGHYSKRHCGKKHGIHSVFGFGHDDHKCGLLSDELF
ncbi:hypothetical protein [Thermomonospora umbrina]|uniref:Uncharacterized protein n=1 Tax=Thermomonospora umbrina TaxID=111806 RepID=A0A3D9SRX4_9ACTN|nr:hypothetical protein [Thermomonospora umbrina]REE95364.1 hypothetical protein DFJ69_0751 [Thermomonospora umbrina]